MVRCAVRGICVFSPTNTRPKSALEKFSNKEISTEVPYVLRRENGEFSIRTYCTLVDNLSVGNFCNRRVEREYFLPGIFI